MRKGSFKNISQKPRLSTTGIYKYKEKQPLVLLTFFFGSVVSLWLLTSKHKTQERLNILQMGQCLAALKYALWKPNTSEQTQESIRR